MLTKTNLIKKLGRRTHYFSGRIAILLVISELVVGVIGLIKIENYSFIDALYMTIITASTVGFTEVQPLTNDGKLFISIFITINVFVFAYIISVFSSFVIDGGVFLKWYQANMKKKISNLKDHVIICGFGRHGKEVAHNLELHNIPTVIIEKDPRKIALIHKMFPDQLYLEEDASDDNTLIAAGLSKAKALITALPDDSDNLFTVLTARSIAPNIIIISRIIEHKSIKKLKLAGADHTIMPEQIGGFHMSSLVSKPGAVQFFSFITNDYESDIGFEEVFFKEFPEEWKGQMLKKLKLRQKYEVTVIGHHKQDGSYIVNPCYDTTIVEGESFILFGNEAQLKKVKDLLVSFPN